MVKEIKFDASGVTALELEVAGVQQDDWPDAAPPSTGQHPSHLIFNGDATTPHVNGFSTGNHYFPDPDGLEPGATTRVMYIGADTADATTWTAAEIETQESLASGAVTGAWLAAQSVYGFAETHALEEALGLALWGQLLPDANNAATDAQESPWLLFERGGAYTTGTSVMKSGKVGESPLHPIVIGAWGTGARPTFDTPISQSFSTQPLTNFVLNGLEPTAVKFNTQGVNLMVNDCRMGPDESSCDSGDFERVTYNEVVILDSARHEPKNGATSWSTASGAEIHSGLRPVQVYGLLMRNLLCDHSGWADTFARDLSYNAGQYGQPPSQKSHNLYVQKNCRDVTFNNVISGRAANSGAQFRSGGHQLYCLFFENNIGFQLASGSSDNGNHCAILRTLVVGAGCKWVNDPPGIGYVSKVAQGINGGSDVYPVLHQTIVCNGADPNNATDVTNKTNFKLPPNNTKNLYSGGTTSVASNALTKNPDADFKVHFWPNIAGFHTHDYNIDGLTVADMDEVTIANYADTLRATTGSTIDDFVAYLAGLASLDGVGEAIWKFAADRFDYSYTNRAGVGTVTFAPWIGAEGWRWDNFKNWSTGYRPGAGDTVNLNGKLVTSYEVEDVNTLNLGDDGELRIYGGKIDANDITGTGDIKLYGAGQLWADAVSTGDKTITLDDGRFKTASTISDNVSIDAKSRAEVLVEAGGALTIATGQTMTLRGDKCRVGFDGVSGSASITIAGTLSFIANARVTYDLTTSKDYPQVGETITSGAVTATVISNRRFNATSGEMVVEFTAGTAFTDTSAFTGSVSGGGTFTDNSAAGVSRVGEYRSGRNGITATNIASNVVLSSGSIVSVVTDGLASGTYDLIDVDSLTDNGATLPSGVAVVGNKLVLTVS